ncbi:unnamed protein product, partial [Brassica oleracea var. botrytis]
QEAKKPDIEKFLEVVATLEARMVLVRRLNLTYVMFSLCEYVKLSKQTTVQATEVADLLEIDLYTQYLLGDAGSERR